MLNEHISQSPRINLPYHPLTARYTWTSQVSELNICTVSTANRTQYVCYPDPGWLHYPCCVEFQEVSPQADALSYIFSESNTAEESNGLYLHLYADNTQI